VRVREHQRCLDVSTAPWLPWVAVPLVLLWGMILVVTVVAPLLALVGIGLIAVTTRCRRWRFDPVYREVRFAKGLLPWRLSPERTLVQRPGMRHTFTNVFLGGGERVELVRFDDIERADVEVKPPAGHGFSSTHALVLRIKDGATIGFGVGGDSAGLEAKRRAAEAINGLLAKAAAPALTPASTDAESFAGSPIAVPSLVVRDQ